MGYQPKKPPKRPRPTDPVQPEPPAQRGQPIRDDWQHLPLSLIAQGWKGDEGRTEAPDSDDKAVRRAEEAVKDAIDMGLVTPETAGDLYTHMLGTKADSMRRAFDRGLVTPAMARDAFVSMVKADTPPPAPRPRTTSPERDRFESKYGARPLPTNGPRPRRRWLWRTLYVVATLVTLAASVATLWHLYGG